jgi:predicted kinase
MMAFYDARLPVSLRFAIRICKGDWVIDPVGFRFDPSDRVVLMCGLAGSGKTTVALQLEACGYLRLSFDEFAWNLGYREHPVAPMAAQQVHFQIEALVLQAVRDDIPVVIDSSFWSRQSRNRIRDLLTPFGTVPIVYYMVAEPKELRRRVRGRKNLGPHDIRLTGAVINRHLQSFEPPTAAEGPVRQISL